MGGLEGFGPPPALDGRRGSRASWGWLLGASDGDELGAVAGDVCDGFDAAHESRFGSF